ncbi:hypothetical protein BJ912DRAFT_1098508 [Pholiota molesta]|nr:hypothetical protein BJ912DRAFT_1098508 [Pholiota molesta]
MEDFSLTDEDEIPSNIEDDNEWEDDCEQSGDITPIRGNLESSVLPPSSGPRRSSPIVGTKAERALKRIKKGHAKRRVVMQKKQATERQTEQARRQGVFNEILERLHENGLRFWDLMEYVFNPAHGQGTIRYNEFFARKGNAPRMLDWWMSAQNRGQRAKEEISEWIMRYATRIISREAEAVTRSKELQTQGRTINLEVIRRFNLDEIHDHLQFDLAPFTMQLIQAFTTAKRVQKHTDHRKERTRMVITSAALLCLGEYSHSNNLAKRMLGLYLYASGAQRQCITVLSTLGLSESYTNLTSKNIRRKRKVKKNEDDFFMDPTSSPSSLPPDSTAATAPPSEYVQYTGTLQQLSDSMRSRAQEVAATGLFSVVYDNVNINLQNAEQIIGRHDSQENGTSATLIPLFDANLEDLDLTKFQSAYLNAPQLKLQDILHTSEEQKVFKNNIIHTILRTIVKHGGPGFEKFEKELEECQPESQEKIPIHTTELHPLPTWNIDESSIVGNAEVDEVIMKELGLDKLPVTSDRVRFLGGDQLSIARLRALEFVRAGQEQGYEGFFWGAWIPGLFHAKIADAHGTLLTHFGKPDSGAKNPGSLAFHNSNIDRLPIVLTSLPTFRTCRDLIFVSLYARVLHCLLLVSGFSSLGEYALKVDKWETLVGHATAIFERYANSALVDDLRSQRAEWIDELEEDGDSSRPTEGDAVFENASLFLRDALISREFNDAIKAGDSGRVILVLKIWALSFRGSGRTKYAYEMLHLIHNLTNVWPKPIQNIVMKNWLLNPSGLPNRFIEMDLVQEHLNLKIKVSYKAHGSNASWEWLETISPCVVALGELQKTLNDTLGGDQGTKHAPPDLKDDIESLMTILQEHKIYQIQKGRILKDDEIVKDVIAVGLRNLTSGEKNPLSDYNAALARLQARRKMNPVSLTMLQTPIPSSATPIPPTPTSMPTADETYEPEGDVVAEPMTEVEQILLDLENGVVDETLPRLTEDDVALDMDEVVVEDDDAVDEDESDMDESEDDIGWIDEL